MFALLIALFLSILTGWLLSFGETGLFLAKDVLFPAGIFYLALLVFLAVPLQCMAFVLRGEQLIREWRRCAISSRLYVFWCTALLGAAVAGTYCGAFMAFAEPVFPTDFWYLEEVTALRKFLPALAVLSVLAGSALSSMKEEAATVSHGTTSLFRLLEQTGQLLVTFMPAGVFLLLAPWFAFTGYGVLLLALKLCLAMLVCCAAYAFAFYGLSLRRCGKNCPGHFWSFFKQVVFLGMAGKSLANCTNSALSNLQRMGIETQKKPGLFTSGLSWGAAGTALYCSLALTVALQYGGMTLSMEQMILTAFFSLLLAVFSVEFSNGGLYRLLFLFLLLDVPIAGLFSILATERFLDGVRTGVNLMSSGTGIYLADKLRWR